MADQVEGAGELQLSVVIPARDEEDCIATTVTNILRTLREAGIRAEAVVVDDGSTDATPELLTALCGSHPELRWFTNPGQPGFGMAVRAGLAASQGTYVAVMMADLCDDPEDLVCFVRTAEKHGVAGVFGARFCRRDLVQGYPGSRRLANRAANRLVRLAFGIPYDDFTNAFKLYRRRELEALGPLQAGDFALSLELPLRLLLSGVPVAVLPNRWSGRTAGRSKFRFLRQLPGYTAATLRTVRRTDRKPIRILDLTHDD